MKTQKEIEIIQDTYDTSVILCNLFAKYKNYDSTLVEHYDSSTLFANRKKEIRNNITDSANIAMVKYKEPLFKKIINKLKSIFIR